MSPPIEPVRRVQVFRDVQPREVYNVVVDFPAYPRLFRELSSARIVHTQGAVSRVEFRAQVVMPVRYVVDLVCNPETLAVDWTYVEGEVVTNSAGGWRFLARDGGTEVDYRASLDVKAPVPGFVLRKVIDGLLAASLPSMFTSLEREVHARRAG